MTTKAKINKYNHTKLKIFCKANEVINKAKRQHMEWENIFSNYISGKGLRDIQNRNSHNLIITRIKKLN